jgi:hypothetical protein
MIGQQHELDVAFVGIVKRIGALFASNFAGGGRPEWPEIEAVLTDGYALALDLETERNRRRASGTGYSIIDRDIRWLRSILAELHVQGRRFRGPVGAPALRR